MNQRIRGTAIYAGLVLLLNLIIGAVVPAAAEQAYGCGRSCDGNGACHAPSGCTYCIPNPFGPIGSCIKP